MATLVFKYVEYVKKSLKIIYRTVIFYICEQILLLQNNPSLSYVGLRPFNQYQPNV